MISLENRICYAHLKYISSVVLPVEHQNRICLSVPPKVAESRKCVPYFLMMFSVIFCKVGLRPSNLMLWRNSGSRGAATPLLSCLSKAMLLTLHLPNSLRSKVNVECSIDTGWGGGNNQDNMQCGEKQKCNQQYANQIYLPTLSVSPTPRES